MVSFQSLAGEGWRRTESVRWLVVVPFVWSFAQFGSVQSVLDYHGFTVGLRLPVPAALPTLWTFARVPSSGITVNPPTGAGGVFPPILGVPVAFVVGGLLTAGFLGELHAAMAAPERRGFVENVVRFAVPQLSYAALVALAGVLVGGLASVFPPAILVAFVGFFVAGYLFWATPFLVVTDDRSLAEAVQRSYRLAMDGGEHASFFFKYLGAGALLSIPVTLFTVNFGFVGLFLGAVVTAPLCLAFSAAALAYLDGGPVSREVGGTSDHGPGAGMANSDTDHPRNP
ncbi:hypothetical protein ACFPYI_13070 [Halomarina salina]|uniref:DUF4013 domain-containing protein n=1 Tax=Halomarina salina TaxID=1872699 RepID=A0ABD5RNQ0_9EURY|nr:hypothetical protein [Halomarina salina]